MLFSRRHRTALGLFLSGLLLAGCSAPHDTPVAATPPATAPAAPAADHRVVIDNFTFSPATLTVPVGAAVTWVNRDDVPHTVTSPTRPRLLESPALDTDDTFRHVFTEPGTYAYYCTVHPRMTGQIIVK
jgi:plastocyanin